MDAFLQEVLQEVDNIDFDEDSEMFEYLGFNPAKILDYLLNKQPDRSKLIPDVIHMLALATMRGTNIEKSVMKMSDSGKAKVQQLKATYNLKSRASAANVSEPTLTRIMAAFPSVAIEVRTKLGSPVVGTLPTGMPPAFAFPSAPSLIPQGDDKRYSLWLEWAKSFGIIINNPDESRINQYGLISWKSPVVPDSERAKIVSKYWP